MGGSRVHCALERALVGASRMRARVTARGCLESAGALVVADDSARFHVHQSDAAARRACAARPTPARSSPGFFLAGYLQTSNTARSKSRSTGGWKNLRGRSEGPRSFSRWIE